MILDIAEERLVVVSDLHLGNPASQAGKTFRSFLDFVRRERLCLCINGDGFEMLQARFSRLIREALPLLGQISRLRREGGRVYYVVGNHDIYMEHFLDEWLVTGVSPFLNVTSGDKRIRIEQPVRPRLLAAAGLLRGDHPDGRHVPLSALFCAPTSTVRGTWRPAGSTVTAGAPRRERTTWSATSEPPPRCSAAVSTP